MPKWTKEQQEAIEKDGSNILVSAGAGSGKTAVLSERVINKLEKGIHVNELLILTFTKAAASEMKDRIRKKISKREEFKEELNLLNSSYITTFDSFALSVVKKYHYLLNISKDVAITDESIVRIEQNKIIDEIFEEKYLNNDQDFLNLIDTYCVKNDNKIREIIRKIAVKIDSLISKEQFIKNIKEKIYSEENINNIIEEYRKFIDEKRELIILEFENMSFYFDGDYMQKVSDSIQNILNIKFEDLHLITKVSLPAVPRGSDDEQKTSKEKLKKAIDELLDYSTYGTIEDIKYDILSSKQIVFEIIDIVEKYIKKLQEYKEKNNIYTFNDIATLAIKIVKEFKEAREELKYSFKEIMIDEYQDTNDVQDIFMSYIENDNVYMVGDIKQSIYRFRGSNPNIFKDKYDSYSKEINGRKIDLIKNFRSRSEVLNNINRIFELIMDLEIGGAEYKESHEMIYGNTTYDEEKEKEFNYDIDILKYENDKEHGFTDSEIEIFTIANDIKNKMQSKMKVFDKEENKLRQITYNDFVVILDRSRYFNDYKRIFEYLSIPTTILQDDKLNTSTDISIIKNIMDFIIRISENDYGIEFKYDFISISRSFLYELDDQYIFDTFKNNTFKETKVFKDFEHLKDLNSYTCNEVYNEILTITDFYNKIYKIGDYENTNVRIKSIHDISCNLNKLGYTINEFRDYLNEIIENDIEIKYNAFSTDAQCVKLMTIHKSKGLEYPVCYFADLDHKFNMSDANEMFVIDNKYGLIVPSSLEEKKNSVIKELYKNNYSKEEISEKIRLFYVALTRAREKMIVVLPNKDITKLEKDDNGVINKIRRFRFNKLSDLIYAVEPYLLEYFKTIDINEIGLTKSYLYKKTLDNKLNESNEIIDVKEISIKNEIETQSHFSKESSGLVTKEILSNMKYGTMIHEVFELIDFKNYDETIIKDEFIRNKVTKFLNNELLSNVKNAEIYHEYEFEYKKNNTEYHGIIDLMLEYENNIDIIDFKLKNVNDENYIKQLNGYKNYIEEISSKNVNIYLYSIIDEKMNQII